MFFTAASVERVNAWTEKSYFLIAQDAVQLMPDNFQWLVDTYRESFHKGLTSSVKDYQDRREVVNDILIAAKDGVDKVQKHHQYKDAAYTFGVLARLASKLNHPLAFNCKLNNANWKTDYDIYLEKQRIKFRIRWKGRQNLPKTEADLSGMLEISSKKNHRI